MNWTPTLTVLDPEGHQRYRFSGYLPAADFLTQLEMGLAHTAFAHKDWPEAERHFRAASEKANDEVAAEAIYWIGTSQYKRTQDPSHLQRSAQELNRRHPSSTWTKRSTPWMGEKKPAEKKTA